MLERFSREAAAAVTLAGQEARRLGHGHLGTEHLLLGLLAEGSNPASDALLASGASLVSVRGKVAEALASRNPGSAAEPGRVAGAPDSDLPLTERASRALDRAGRLSLRQGNEEVCCEHVLVSLLDVEGTAGQVLRGIAVDPEAVKQALRRGGPGSGGTPEPEPAAGAAGSAPASEPLCAKCGAELRSSLDRTRLATGTGRHSIDVEVYFCRACGAALGAARP